MEVQSPMKRHYDLSMSRRTRKLNLPPVVAQGSNNHGDERFKNVEEKNKKMVVSPKKSDENNNGDHKSLKQLINIVDGKNSSSRNTCNNNGAGVGGEGGSNNRGRNSLGEHFNEEEKQQQLQLVVVPQNKENGLKFNKLVRRYAKVLGHFIKKPESAKKPLFKLST
ncbi:hypothetical protein PIB30_057329 [Stylosanthes scabra]|uniref:Uncharacterized protein n=1 Tax=Stylosanthes scabra TaxID=79078 RepID=A0ABU6SKV8_9FABA|nr:hypothetical protein [Stylosanthes scabra]